MLRIQERLFKLFSIIQEHNQVVPITAIDKYIELGKPATFLKHDVHGLHLQALISFAKTESNVGVFGSYFFMFPNHPRTVKYYSYSEQINAMKSIANLGHEIGIHIDPFFLIHRFEEHLPKLLDEFVNELRAYGLNIDCGNIHGNSAFKGKDKNGFGTSFDFFEEIARQPDYPTLKDVDINISQLIKQNRMKVSDIGLRYWADMPPWSQKYGFVVTNFITDNLLAKNSKMLVTIQPDVSKGYKLSDYQPPGSRTQCKPREFTLFSQSVRDVVVSPGTFPFQFYGSDLENVLHKLSRLPNTLLIHPEHYCE